MLLASDGASNPTIAMQFIIWTGIVILGLITLSTVGMIFFHTVGELRKGASSELVAEPIRPTARRKHLRKVDLESLRDHPPARRAA
ncbi:MAG: hypothetical protein ACI9W4_001196 [Rhodothermales bacterium]|jgi:hypothetical protein